MSAPDWVEHVVWWQVYPLGFVGADTTAPGDGVRHRLGRLEGWLDYLVELGASGLALGPIFASSSHGYDTIDYLRIDPRLGDERDFAHLVAAAHDRGLRVLLDGVFNHVGRDFPTFQQALQNGPDSAEAHWFVPRSGGGSGADGYENFEGHDSLVTLRHENPAVADFVVEVMNHWLAAGADGWRLDAAYAVPTAFWAEVLPRVRADFPDAYVVGEVIHGDYPELVTESRLDSLTQYELWKAIWSSLNDGNLFELGHAMDRHNGYLDTFVPLTFIGNHDVTRIASKLTDPRHLPHAVVTLLTVGGTPSLYYGDEQAFRGVKEDREGGDDAVRPSFPEAGPEALAPDGWPTYRLHQLLIGLRRRHPWLHRARTAALELTNTAVLYRASLGDDRILVALNLDDEPFTAELPEADLEVLAGEAEVSDDNRLSVAGHGWAVLG